MIGQGYRIIGLSTLLLSLFAFAYGEESKVETKTWDSYKSIAEKNVFSRNRKKALSATEIQQLTPVVSEQSCYTLRGITKEPDGYVAFLEDSRGMSVTRCHNGGTVANGKITAITLDNLSYTYGGKTLKLEIGMNLEGQATGIQYASRGSSNQGRGGFQAMGQVPGGQGGMNQMAGGQGQAAMGQMPGGQGQGGMNQMPGGQGQAGMGQMAGGQGQGGMNQMQGGRGEATGQTSTTGQDLGRSQGPGGRMGQGQTAVQGSATGQVQAGTGQVQSMGQSQAAVQAATGIQTRTTVQTGTQQQSESSDEITQRLKEKRKKELEE